MPVRIPPRIVRRPLAPVPAGTSLLPRPILTPSQAYRAGEADYLTIQPTTPSPLPPYQPPGPSTADKTFQVVRDLFGAARIPAIASKRYTIDQRFGFTGEGPLQALESVEPKNRTEAIVRAILALPVTPVQPTPLRPGDPFLTQLQALGESTAGVPVTFGPSAIGAGVRGARAAATVGAGRVATRVGEVAAEARGPLAQRGSIIPGALPGGVPPTPPPVPPTTIGTPQPPDDVIKRFTTFIHSPESLNLAELTTQMRSKQLGQRLAALQKRTDELLSQGKKFEDALAEAQTQTMTGAFDRPVAALTESMAEEFRDAAFAKVYDVLKAEPLEQISTAEALRNALAGQGIPRKLGTAGGSAYTRLSRIFPPEVMQALESGKPLEKVLEDSLMSRPFPKLAEWSTYPERSILEGELQTRIIPRAAGDLSSLPRYDPQKALERRLELAGQPIPMKKSAPIPERGLLNAEQQGELLLGLPSDLRGAFPSKTQADQATLELALELSGRGGPRGTPLGPVPRASTPFSTPFGDASIQEIIKQPSMMPLKQRELLVETLKEAGWTTIDIGNALRANMASGDFSWWRQQIGLIPNNKRDFMVANLSAWRGMWDKSLAKASLDRIQKHKYYALYEDMAAKPGNDFLRPLEQKGLPAWQREEAFMILGSDRPIPRLMEKLPWVRLSQRAFVTGTNEMNWRIFTRYVDNLFAQNEKMAAGRMKIPKGGFNIEKEIGDFSAFLTDMTGRANLGRMGKLSAPMNAGFFSLRLNLGRLLTPRHLFSTNPRVRVEAWKNIATFVGTIGMVELLGEKLDLWNVEKNPLSADFAQMRVGDTRVDPWGGYRKFVTFAGRITTQEYKSSSTGEQTETDAIRTTGNFIRSMLSPLASLATDVTTKKNYIGEEVSLSDPKQWVERMAPFALRDIVEGLREEGVRGGLIASTALVGAGSSTYPTPLVEYTNVPKTLSPDLRDAYERYQDAGSPSEEKRLRDTDSLVRRALFIVETRQAELRKKKPEIDVALAKRGRKPQTPEGLIEYLKKVPEEEREGERERIKATFLLDSAYYWTPWRSPKSTLSEKERLDYEEWVRVKGTSRSLERQVDPLRMRELDSFFAKLRQGKRQSWPDFDRIIVRFHDGTPKSGAVKLEVARGQVPGISPLAALEDMGPDTQKALEIAGIRTLEDLGNASFSAIMRATNASERRIDAWRSEARRLLSVLPQAVGQ